MDEKKGIKLQDHLDELATQNDDSGPPDQGKGVTRDAPHAAQTDSTGAGSSGGFGSFRPFSREERIDPPSEDPVESVAAVSSATFQKGA